MSYSWHQDFAGVEPQKYYNKTEPRLKPLGLGHNQLGTHQELYEKWIESEARLDVLVRALRRIVKYKMTAKKASETIVEALAATGMSE